MGEQYPQGGKHGDSQNDGLEDVRPDDGFQSSDRGVNGRGDGDGNQGGNVEQDNLAGVCRDACQELVGNDQQNAREIEPGSAGEYPADQEDHGGCPPRQEPESFFQVFIDGNNLVVIIGLEKEPADDDAAQDGADAELGVREVAGMVSFPGSSQEGGRADFRRQDRGQNSPPGQGTVAQGIVCQGVLPSSRIDAYAEDSQKVDDDDEKVREHAWKEKAFSGMEIPEKAPGLMKGSRVALVFQRG